MKQVSTFSLLYGDGFDPATDVAVANDGSAMALMGLNVAPMLIAMTPDCGTYAIDQANEDSVTMCKLINLPVNAYIDQFYVATKPSFDEGGGQLSLFAASRTGETKLLTMRAAGYGGQKLAYLALGDSFSSGEGETSDDHYLPHTNEPYEKCHTSDRSYPFLVGALLHDSSSMQSVACSGAQITDISGQEIDYWGQGDRVGLSGLRLSDEQKVIQQQTALQNFIAGEIHQEQFVDYYRPSTITIGIGGNDAGLMSKLKACIMPGTCEWAEDPQSKSATSQEISLLYDKLTSLYGQLRQVSPNSHIYAIGYPKIFDLDVSCDPATDTLMDSVERKFANESVMYIDQIMKAAATATGVMYIDTSDSFDGFALCDTTNTPAMNELRTGDDIAPINDADWLKLFGDETFHPTPFGHQLLAQTISKQILDGSMCSDCATSNSPPAPSSYWQENTDSSATRQVSDSFIQTDSVFGPGAQLVLSVKSDSFLPDSSVHIEIHSQPQIIGDYSVDNNGGLSTTIVLPAGLDNGYHVIHIYGTSYSGEPIDVYQLIQYLNPHIGQDMSLLQTSKPETSDSNESVRSAIEPAAALKENPKPTLNRVPLIGVLGAQATGQLNNQLLSHAAIIGGATFLMIIAGTVFAFVKRRR